MTAHARWLLGIAAFAIGFAAIDTYVVVLALPEMMTSVDLDVTELQRAAPVISGFLLGYIAVLPIIGRVSDIHGRVPVLLFSLIVFSLGSFITATSTDLITMVVGRFAQGIGGGGLIPPTLALVADVWPPRTRGVPLGIIGAVQELGSVIGPLFGAAVLAFAEWPMIFWINVAVALLIALFLAIVARRLKQTTNPVASTAPAVRDWWLWFWMTLSGVSFVLWMISPASLTSDVTLGLAFVPILGTSVHPLMITTMVGAGCALGQHIRRHSALWRLTTKQVDIAGALGLSLALGAIVIVFASSEPETHIISQSWAWIVPIGILGLILFGYRQRAASIPLVPAGIFANRAAWGAQVVSFFIGVALISVLVDVPVFARLTVAEGSQFQAALVLLRFLVALPIGAVLGGYLTRWLNPALVSGCGLIVAAASFAAMSRWDATALTRLSSDVVLVLAGLAIGVTIAPVNSRLLDSTTQQNHGLASAFLVVFRMMGMLLGISALTAIGLNRFYSAEAAIPDIAVLCGAPEICEAYTAAVVDAALTQLRTVFLGAGISCVIGSILSFSLLYRTTWDSVAP